jgi:hypothetical protein
MALAHPTPVFRRYLRPAARPRCRKTTLTGSDNVPPVGLDPTLGEFTSISPVFTPPVVGIPERMDKVIRLRHAQHRIVKVQRRLWLAQVLMWPTVILAAVSSVGGLAWFLRRRSTGGRHEMPDTPGAHEDGTVRVEPNGQVTPA